MTFSRHDLINRARVPSAGASEAYADERLTTAATYHALAARIWAEAGYPAKATHHGLLASAIDSELIELAAGEEETA